ncbi:hypothetical protein F503_08456 [Ophiostoma piceae UAMH 11346]|uniref:Uncharacterized protein n=1 Tax=Ophiostoma piceae (strain UAMH 11346) TaxID=1262450 RepID=S3CYD2_OPHP1|nr:hypothetical protein F503_08456 [Ophiostoma piceae UAMH 11346]
MDSPPAKRRRTSPRLSGRSDDAEPDTTEAAAAPSSQPQSKIPRPSFASPTRASLARHNPAILGRRESLPRSSQADDGGAGEAVNNSNGVGNEDTAPAFPVRPLARPPMRSPTRSPARSVSPTRALSMPPVRSPVRRPSRSLSRSPTRRLFGSASGGLFGVPPQQSPKAVRQQQQPEKQLGSAASFPDRPLSSVPGSLLGELPRRSPIKPVPRPLPPPDPQRSEDILEPLIAREKRLRTGLDMFRVHEEHIPEPELPPTPEHPSPDLTTSPPGIHNQHQSSTPSKRPKRVGRLRGGDKSTAKSSSSPLKQPPVQGPDQDGSEQDGTDSRKHKSPLGNTTALKESDGNVPRRGPAQKQQALPPPPPETTGHSNVRGIKPVDPDAARKKERDDMLAEIVALKADLTLAATENTRIREAVEEQSGSVNSISTPPNASDIIDLLRRRAVPDEDEDDKQSRDELATVNWLQMAANPIAFLPFGKPRADVAGLVQLFAGGSTDEDQDLPPPISHHPIEMSAAEELPFLQAFTPLAFHSQIFTLASAPSNNAAPLLQKHVITASSTAPSGVFLARMEMTVHTKSLKIVDLRVPRIEPPEARIELQPLLDRVTGSADGTAASDPTSASSALARNVTVLSWAMGEWVRVAVRRAKFWAALARLLREKGAGMADAIHELKSRATAAKAQKRGRHDNDDDDNDAARSISPVSKRELLEHIGRTGMDVDIPALFQPSQANGHNAKTASMTGVRVEWDINFDWTGEATSKMRLLVGVPGKWRKADKKGSLGKLPRLFDKMVHTGGDPMRAVQTVVALLAGEEGL